MPPELAGYRVTRPGLVLVDAAARSAALRALPPPVREELCGWPTPKPPDEPPVATIAIDDAGGADNDAGQRFALAVMVTGAAAFGLDDDGARETLVAALDGWADAGALTSLERDAANAYYALDRILLPTLVAWSLVRAEPAVGSRRRERIDRWLRRLVRTRGDLRPAREAGDLAARNNHAYLAGSVGAAWGALTGDDEYFRSGIAAYRQAIGDLRADGSLPLETERGARALWYQRHAIASLTVIAEIAAVQGYDLYGFERNGRDLHRAVRFLLDAVDEPLLVEGYAAANVKPGAGDDYRTQDLGFLTRRGQVRHYMAWAETYIGRFPGREESRRLEVLLAGRDAAFRPMLDDYSGGPTTCLFRAPEAAA